MKGDPPTIPIPVVVPEERDEALFYWALAEEYGYDPLTDETYHDYYVACDLYDEAKQALSELVTIPLNQ